MAKEQDLALHADRLWRLIEARTQLGTDTDELDQKIWDLFGERHAIMVTDLSGFSRHVETFGIIHFLQIIHESRKLFFPILDEHLGVLVKSEADSLLATFRSPERALRCAMAMQRATRQINPRRKPEEQIHLCVGLGYGDILRIGHEDIWGREVNAASKLGEDTARGGETLVTAEFLHALPKLDDALFERIGEVAGSQENFRFLGSS